MRVLSLFAGIGGFDLAAHWMGWATAVFVEWEDFPRQVLQKNFKCVPVEQLSATELAAIINQWRAWVPGLPQPTSVLYGDICHFDARQWLGAIDLVCGGFPCQPFSSAGANEGINDSRHLWPQMLRVICEVRPQHIVGENVRGLLTKHPLQFEAVCADLEAQGYDVQPFLLPAAGVGAPHERYRFWFVAHAHDGQRQRPQQQVCSGRHAAGLCREAAAHASGAGREEPHAASFAAQPGFGAGHGDEANAAHSIGERWEEQSPLTFTTKKKGGGSAYCGGQDAATHAAGIGRHAGTCRGICKRNGKGTTLQSDSQWSALRCPTHGCSTPVGHPDGNGQSTVGEVWGGQSSQPLRDSQESWRLTEPPLRGADDGLSARLVRTAGNSKQARRLARRIEKLDAGAARNSLKAYGNGIVPQVAYRIFQAIDAACS